MTAGIGDSRPPQWRAMLTEVNRQAADLSGELGGTDNAVAERRMILTSLRRNLTRALADIQRLEQP